MIIDRVEPLLGMAHCRQVLTMHGGIKVYAGAPAAARHYLEADRARADDYYLTEGTGLARRFNATDGRVAELAPLAGDGYQAWVAGTDPIPVSRAVGCAPTTGRCGSSR
jgi:hypothetical protein